MTAKRPDLSVGEALVGLLEAYGVSTIFGIPGVHNVELYRALPRSGIRHILTRHEQGAGFMADGFARATGKPGVCFTITGPGLTNILTPMGQAWSDSSSVLVIASALDVADSAQGRGRLHEMLSQNGAAAAVTAHHARAYTPADVEDAMARIFAGFASQRPRPAYLELPIDVLAMDAQGPLRSRKLPARPRAAPHDVAEAVAKLQAAKAPVLILGGGALDAGAEALAVAEALSAPILTTTAGKGAVPASHPLCWGYRLARPDIQEMLAKSDCVLAVGSELSETDFWGRGLAMPHLIRIDIDPASLTRPHAAEIALLGDAKATLADLAQGLKARKGTHPQAPALPDDGPLRTQLGKVLAVIRDSLPAETVIASDMTQIAYAANEVFPVSSPRTWLHPVGFGTLGFALPAGIGAKIALAAGWDAFQSLLDDDA